MPQKHRDEKGGDSKTQPPPARKPKSKQEGEPPPYQSPGDGPSREPPPTYQRAKPGDGTSSPFRRRGADESLGLSPLTQYKPKPLPSKGRPGGEHCRSCRHCCRTFEKITRLVAMSLTLLFLFGAFTCYALLFYGIPFRTRTENPFTLVQVELPALVTLCGLKYDYFQFDFYGAHVGHRHGNAAPTAKALKTTARQHIWFTPANDPFGTPNNGFATSLASMLHQDMEAVSSKLEQAGQVVTSEAGKAGSVATAAATAITKGAANVATNAAGAVTKGLGSVFRKRHVVIAKPKLRKRENELDKIKDSLRKYGNYIKLTLEMFKILDKAVNGHSHYYKAVEHLYAAVALAILFSIVVYGISEWVHYICVEKRREKRIKEEEAWRDTESQEKNPDEDPHKSVLSDFEKSIYRPELHATTKRNNVIPKSKRTPCCFCCCKARCLYRSFAHLAWCSAFITLLLGAATLGVMVFAYIVTKGANGALKAFALQAPNNATVKLNTEFFKYTTIGAVLLVFALLAMPIFFGFELCEKLICCLCPCCKLLECGVKCIECFFKHCLGGPKGMRDHSHFHLGSAVCRWIWKFCKWGYSRIKPMHFAFKPFVSLIVAIDNYICDRCLKIGATVEEDFGKTGKRIVRKVLGNNFHPEETDVHLYEGEDLVQPVPPYEPPEAVSQQRMIATASPASEPREAGTSKTTTSTFFKRTVANFLKRPPANVDAPEMSEKTADDRKKGLQSDQTATVSRAPVSPSGVASSRTVKTNTKKTIITTHTAQNASVDTLCNVFTEKLNSIFSTALAVKSETSEYIDHPHSIKLRGLKFKLQHAMLNKMVALAGGIEHERPKAAAGQWLGYVISELEEGISLARVEAAADVKGLVNQVRKLFPSKVAKAERDEVEKLITNSTVILEDARKLARAQGEVEVKKLIGDLKEDFEKQGLEWLFADVVDPQQDPRNPE